MIFKFLFLQIYHLFSKEAHALEYDAKVQYQFHRVMALLWFLAMLVIPFFPSTYSGSIGLLVVLEVSLYANFATEFGAMSAALAAIPSGQSVK